ncbi:unnamed protein product [Protopolystoma xenopodis]|uniref:Uncharacterized protein n=1 Tax=Protopolystoma xenopodis TaxID=117903 RepID=A0A3S4ZYX2_9PLAT|nr:unnamed protein product [Protopolystoma xenopodis]
MTSVAKQESPQMHLQWPCLPVDTEGVLFCIEDDAVELQSQSSDRKGLPLTFESLWSMRHLVHCHYTPIHHFCSIIFLPENVTRQSYPPCHQAMADPPK